MHFRAAVRETASANGEAHQRSRDGVKPNLSIDRLSPTDSALFFFFFISCKKLPKKWPSITARFIENLVRISKHPEASRSIPVEPSERIQLNWMTAVKDSIVRILDPLRIPKNPKESQRISKNHS